MTPDISCRSLIQIAIQITRWRTKWRPCKCVAVSQAFLFHFKWYSLLHFAACQLLCVAFLIYIAKLVTCLLPGGGHDPFWGLHDYQDEHQVHDRRYVAEGVSHRPRPNPKCSHHARRGTWENHPHGRPLRYSQSSMLFYRLISFPNMWMYQPFLLPRHNKLSEASCHTKFSVSDHSIAASKISQSSIRYFDYSDNKFNKVVNFIIWIIKVSFRFVVVGSSSNWSLWVVGLCHCVKWNAIKIPTWKETPEQIDGS